MLQDILLKKTWIEAIKNGHYATWPGLTPELVAKHLPDTSEETAAGHLHRRRQGVQSTRPRIMQPELPGQGKINPDRKERVGVHIISNEDIIIELNGMIATDQTGRFPIVSDKGNQYIMVLYNYDSNAILATACKSRTGPDLVAAYDELHKRLIKAGIVPVIQRLDNEVSESLIEAIESKGLDYQLASPYDHRLNPAERQVQTFKNHLISNLHGCDTSFPAYKWCSIIRQCEMTLNMLRRSRINPKLSAYTQLFGMFDYNRTPLAPLGTKAFVHERPNQRHTHADHGKIAYVIGPSMHHYRHLNFYIPETRGTRDSDTYVFLPTKFELPHTAAADRATQALEEFTAAIRSKTSEGIPFTDKSINNAIRQLSSILSSRRATTSKGGEAAPRVAEDITPPRVLTNETTRSLRMRHTPKHAINTKVYKIFNEQFHEGKIIQYDRINGYYKVRYKDNDEEEYDETEIAAMLKEPSKSDKDNLQRAMSATRYERSELAYAKTENRNRHEPKVFTYGYQRAIDWLEATNFTPPIEQEYRYAHSVIDDETGKILELPALLQHPKYKDTWQEAACNEYGRLFQGYGKNEDGTQKITGTNTCYWVKKSQVPKNKKSNIC